MKQVAIVALALALLGCTAQVTIDPTPSPSPSTVESGSPSGGTLGSPGPTTELQTPPATPSVATYATPVAVNPGPAAGPFGVLVDSTASGSLYAVSLVGLDGRVARTFVGAKRTPIVTAEGHAVELPYVSTSSSALYYLDGDNVRSATPNGATGVLATLLFGPRTEVAFAVSPDNSRIAYSVLDFNRYPVHLTLNVIAAGSGPPNVIYESDSNYVWPVAWRSGLLVLAKGAGPYEESIALGGPRRANPYAAISYHIVDPATGNRVVLLGSCTVSGPVTTAGTGCIQGGSLTWDGTDTNWGTSNWGQVSSSASLSPDGLRMAAAEPGDSTRLAFYRKDNTIETWVDGPATPYWAGWLDSTHVLLPNVSGPGSRIVKLTTGPFPAIPVDASGYFAAVLPTPVN